jgi:putative spermidine/putrescine transport system ATP-binding protein
VSAAYLELQGLEKRFGEFHALRGISVELPAGEFLSLLGPSGCGKTTALRITAGFERASGGRVVIEGRDVTRVAPNRRNIGMVFQAYSLFPNMTAAQNVEFGLRIRRDDRSSRRARVAELLETVGLSEAAKRYPHQLSGGMQQRVALARALAIEPRVLLLDEPLSALDALVRVQLRDEIRRIQKQLGITTLYVTHDQEEALSVSDRVAVMWQGRIEQIGTPTEIYGEPSTPFVAEFIGTMNRLPATVADGDRGEADVDGRRVQADALRGRRPGDRVLVLVRPESMEVEELPAGEAPNGALGGQVSAHSFLGAITRVRIDMDGRELVADIASARAGHLPVGTRVRARFEPTGARVLELDAASEALVEQPLEH